MSESYVKLDDTIWPNPEDPKGVNTLRYHQPTRSVMLTAASYIAAYRALVNMTVKERNELCKKLKAPKNAV